MAVGEEVYIMASDLVEANCKTMRIYSLIMSLLDFLDQVWND